MSVLTPTEAELKRLRESLIASTNMTLRELRQRAETYQLSAREADALREIEEIDFLLGR